MSNKSFTRSIGGSQGSGSINSTSINRSQASGSAVSGYGKPKTGMSGSAAGRVAPEYGAAARGPVNPKPPAKKQDEAKALKSNGKPPNGGRM